MPAKDTNHRHKDLADRVQRRIRQAGLYQYELAAAMDVSGTTVRNWLRTGCTREHYDRIMQAIDDITAGGGPS